MTAAPYPDDLMAFRGTRAWHAEARERAVAELAVQLAQLDVDPRFAAQYGGMLVDAVIGTALPMLEAGWRDAVLRFIATEAEEPAVLRAEPPECPMSWDLQEAVRFLWRLIPPEEMPSGRDGDEADPLADVLGP